MHCAALIISVSIHPILFRRKISNYLQRCYPSASYSVTVRTGREPPHTAKIASTPRHTDRWLRPDGLRHRPHPEQKRAPLLPPGTADRTWHEEHGTGRKKRSAEKAVTDIPQPHVPGVLPGASHKKNAQAPARALQIRYGKAFAQPFPPRLSYSAAASSFSPSVSVPSSFSRRKSVMPAPTSRLNHDTTFFMSDTCTRSRS